MVVLDFDGVCTYSARELVSIGYQPGDPPEQLLRPQWRQVWDDLAPLTVVIFGNELDRDLIGDLWVLDYADHVLSGLDNGIAKPDRRAFQRCALIAGRVDPDRCLVVDDSPANVDAAASLGMQTVLFDTADPDQAFAHLVRSARALNGDDR